MTKKFSPPVWTSASNVTIRELEPGTLSKTGSVYAASGNFNPAFLLKLLDSPADVAELRRVCGLKADDKDRVAMIAKASDKKAERAIAEVLKDAKSAVKLAKDKMIDSAKRDEILATLSADNPSAAAAIAALVA